MKRKGNIYKQILNIETIKGIITIASRGKRKRREVRKVLENIDEYAEAILDMLKNKTYYLLPTHNRTITENGKERKLTISPFFPNRILDYIIVETMKPIIRRGMYEYCIGNVDGRGAMYGQKYIEKKIKNYKYFVKLDIRHFYPSVKPEKLMDCLKRFVKDKDFLDLAETIIIANDELPIGSYYSQWFSNLYLQGIDHYIKEELEVPCYVRYVDDMLLLGNNKKKLLCAMYNISRYLGKLGLVLKRIESVREIETQPIDFLGFRFYKDKTKLRLRIFKSINRRIKRVRKKLHCCLSQARSVVSYLGWFRHIKIGFLYYKNHIENVTKIGFLKRIISYAN